MRETVAMLSLWRNDMERHLERRIEHLLSKEGVSRWIWVIGDSTDNTEDILAAWADAMPYITLIKHDTGMGAATSPDEKLIRQSLTVSAGLAALTEEDDYVLLHESDLISPEDVAPRFLATKRRAVAGWVTLGDGPEVFYDTYAYRRNGMKFTNDPPYHPDYRPDRLFEVDSFGSCFLAPAWALKGLPVQRGGVIEMCAHMRALGLSLWVDPSVHIVQPRDLWEAAEHASV